MTTKSCEICDKSGVTILPVRYSIIPTNGFSPEIPDSLIGDLKTRKLETVDYILRALTTGYLYIYSECFGDSKWKSYVVDVDGCLHPQLSIEATADTPESVEQLGQECRAKGDHYPGKIIAFKEGNKFPPNEKIWLAYSRHKWTPTVCERYAQDESLRSKRMQSFIVSEALTGAVTSKGVAKADQNTVSSVFEFVPKVQLNGLKPYLKQIPGSMTALTDENDSNNNAGAMVDALSTSGKSCSSSPLVIVLQDPIGLTADLNHYRNFYSADLLGKSTTDDIDKNRKSTMANIIDTILTQVDKTAQEDIVFGHFYDRKKFAENINIDTFGEYLDLFKENKSNRDYLIKISNDYSKWLTSEEWSQCQAYDFDKDNSNSVDNHQDWILHCIIGAGDSDDERKFWLDCINRNIAPEKNWLLRMLFGLDEGFIQQLNELRSKASFDSIVEGNQKTSAEFANKITDAVFDTFASLDNLRTMSKAHKSVTSLIVTIEKQLAWLHRFHPKAYVNMVGDMAACLITSANIDIRPYQYLGTTAEINKALANDMDIIVPRAPISGPHNRDVYNFRPGNLSEYDQKLSSNTGQNVMLNPPIGKGQRLQFVAFLISEREGLNSGMVDINTSYRQFLGLDAHLGSEGYISAWGKMLSKGKVASGGVYSAAINFFLVTSTLSAVDSIKSDKTTAGQKTQQTVRVFSNILSFYAGAINIKLVVDELRDIVNPGREALKKSVVKLNLVSTILEVSIVAYDIEERLSNDDIDSALWGALQASMLLAGLWAAAGIAGASGVVPGIGWAFAALIFMAIGVYASIAGAATDSRERLDLEYWLDNGSFGKRALTSGDFLRKNPLRSKAKGDKEYSVKEFADFEEEIKTLYFILFTPNVVFSIDSSVGSDWGYHTTVYENTYSIGVPGYRENTKVNVKAQLINSSKEEETLIEFYLLDGSDQINMLGQSGDIFASASSQPTVTIDKDKSFLRISGKHSLISELGQTIDIVGVKITVNFYPLYDGAPELDVGIEKYKQLSQGTDDFD